MDRLLGLPPVASEHGARLDQMNALVHWLMLLLLVGWSLYFIFVLVRFRRSAHPKADYAGAKGKTAKWTEYGVIVAEAILLIFFSLPLWSERVEAFPDERDATVVRVVGEQFAWNVHYPGADGIFGDTSPELVDVQTNPLGLNYDDLHARDDITTLNELKMPVNKPMLVHLTSKDVIHSFALNDFRVKQDAVPGLSIPLWFTPTVTTAQMRERTGNPEYRYEISCAQLCGLGHFRMRGFVDVQPQAEFDAWMAEQAELQAYSEGDDLWD